MKALVISDIHGNIENLNKILEIYKNEKAQYLIILGDFSSYFYSSTDFEISEILNNMAGAIIAVRGNCDNYEMERMLNFDLDFMKHIKINSTPITITHGHIYNPNNLPEECGKIFLFGHTHVGLIEKKGDKIIANPGSISKPRNGSKKSYILIEEKELILKTLDGEVLKSIEY